MSTSGATRQAKKSISCHLFHLGNVTVKTPLAQALVYLDGGPRESVGIWHAEARRRRIDLMFRSKCVSKRLAFCQDRGAGQRRTLATQSPIQVSLLPGVYSRQQLRQVSLFCRQESIHRIGCATIKSDGMYRAISYIKLEDAFLVTFASPQGNKAFSRPLKFVWSCLEPTPKPSRINSCKIRGVPRILALI